MRTPVLTGPGQRTPAALGRAVTQPEPEHQHH